MLTVKQIFDLAIELGISADPRGKKGVSEYMSRAKKEYEGTSGREKEYFDTERLTNPYIDSAIHVDDGKTKVKRVMAGIDINSADILVASQLAERGRPVDLVIAHHPIGKAIARLHDVMDLQTDVYHAEGMPIHLAEKIMEERMCEVGRGVHGMNHYQVVDVARILGINFINTHTITDNMVDEYIRLYLEKKKPYRLSDLIDSLMEIPEYQEATRQGAGPTIFTGSPKHRVGKFVVEMTGGTEPSNKLYEHFSRSGISTLVSMHIREASMEKARENSMNVVVAGHMSSDSLGMNLFLDELEKRGVEIIPCGGLIRVSRNKATKVQSKKATKRK